MARSFCLILVLIGGIYLVTHFYACSEVAQAANQDSAAELFVFEIYPILESKCFSCHGNDPDKIEAGLDLRTRQSLNKGSHHHTKLIEDGRPEFSPLYQAIARNDPEYAMPPKEGDALTSDEVQAFYSWIVAGAPWPDQLTRKKIAAQAGPRSYNRIRVRTSPGQSESWDLRFYRPQDLWAYRPLRRVRPDQHSPDQHPIDFFINRKLKQVGLKPSQKATRLELIKRLYFDLSGLPPNPRDLSWLLDEAIPATEIVSKLLRSPHYGEQWARHWLDVVRYADSDGFSNDYARPNAWRYRDYVVRCFNQDKPFDVFVKEQIAGDEMNPEDPEHLIATGFLRMGPWEHTGMSVAAETRQFFLDDVTNIVGETFLATPLNCAKCHDHKYDPIPTRDYYGMQAIFASTQFAERPADFLPEENRAYMDIERRRVEDWLSRIEEESEEIVQKEEDAAMAWYRQRNKKYVSKRARRKLDERGHPPRYIGLTFEDLGYRKILQKRRQIEIRNLERFQPWAYSVYNGPFREVRSNIKMRMPQEIKEVPINTYVLQGGSIYAPLDSVQPGILSVLHHDSMIDPSFEKLANIPTTPHGRRTALANWISHPHNPLTARVMVNRIWQHHFGKGLAENSNNFGATGKKPTHPELLDWLAQEFIIHGWSVKYMDSLIVTSETYQRSTRPRDTQKKEIIDPENKYLSHFPVRRLEAEELRDAMLACSGELNTELGGIPIRPEIPLDVALQPIHTMGSVAPAYQPSGLPQMRHRRSLYIERKRAINQPFLQVFNQSDNNISCEDRDESTVVTQAFTMLNSEFVKDRSLVFADRLSRDFLDLEQRIKVANQQILLRDVTSEELQRAKVFIAQIQEDLAVSEFPVRVYPLEVERHMVEEMTGEEFSFREYLDVYEDYQSDIAEVEKSLEVRALAEYLSVLFNTNEFLYLY